MTNKQLAQDSLKRVTLLITEIIEQGDQGDLFNLRQLETIKTNLKQLIKGL